MTNKDNNKESDMIEASGLTPEKVYDAAKELVSDVHGEHFDPDEFKREFASRWREYALYVIRDRAVPDIRDGLKPVQRRILFAMQVGGYTSSGKTYKSARVVGDVIGKYHPHGDSSVYNALVRMAQDWTYRYTLINGQGNFGSIDGDNPAAMRYTECKLHKFGELSVGRRLNMDAVDFCDNYDGELQEPEVLPVEVPYLLLNGTSGIAVSIATDFVPHNINEVLQLCKRLLDYRVKNETGDKNKFVKKYIHGPDFPTGGIVVTSEDEMDKVYKTGRGKFTVRSRIEKEDIGGGKWQLVVSEIPYGVKKEELIVSIYEMIRDKKLPIIEDIYDDSDKDNMRFVIIPKSKKLDPESVIMHLYSVTSLQVNIKVNMNALIDKGERPKVLSFVEAADGWLDFHIDTTIRSSKFRLDKVIKRLHILDGFMIVFLNIDEVIHIIRNEDDPENVLMERFGLSEEQAFSIIELKLRNIKKIGEMEIKQEQEKLLLEKAHLESMISDDAYRTNEIVSKFDEIMKRFGDDRRSEIIFASAKAKTISAEVMVEKEPATAIMTKYGFVKFLKSGASVDKTKIKDGDEVKFVDGGYTTDHVAFIAKSGQVFTKLVADLPNARTEGRHLGEFFTVNHNDPIIHMFVVNAEKRYLITTDAGHTLIVSGDNIINSQKKGKKVFNPDKKATKFFIRALEDKYSHAMFITSLNTMGIISLDSFPELPKGKGVQTIRLSKESTVSFALPITLEDNKIDFGTDDKFSIDPEAYTIERAKAGKKLDTRIVNRLNELFS